MKRLCLLIVAFWALKVSAQNSDPTSTNETENTPLFGIYGICNMPGDQFANSGYKSGGGVGIDWYSKNFLKENNELKLRLGFSMQYTGQGGVTKGVQLHEPENAPGSQTLHNNLFGTDFRTKIMYDKDIAIVKPYFDLFGGMRVFSTAQTLTINTPVKGYQTRTRTGELSSLVLNYGASFGCLIKISDDTFIDLKASYMASNSPVAFVDFKHMGYDGYMYNSNGHSAVPELISIQAGLVFKIRPNPNPVAYAPVSYGATNSYYPYRSNTYHSTYHRSFRSYRSGKALR